VEVADAEKERQAVAKSGALADSWECAGGLGAPEERKRSGYTICTSEMAKAVSGVGETLIGGFNSLFGIKRIRVVVDKEKLLTTVATAGLLEFAEKRRAAAKAADDAARYIAFRRRLESASGKQELHQWLDEFQGDDPDKLREVAALKLAQILQTEAERNRQLEAEKSKRAEENAALMEQKAKEWEERQRQLDLTVQGFRRNLKVEAETNCGPILEIKGSLIKVYSPVAGFGNEHWIRRDKIFPVGYECRFVNGRYDPPTL
jgi:hypothetical protein